MVRWLRDFLLTIMGKRICYSAMGFTNEKCGLRLSSDCSESSIEDILDSLNDAIDDILQNAMPRVSTLNLLIWKCCPVLPLSPCKSTLCFWEGNWQKSNSFTFLVLQYKAWTRKDENWHSIISTYRQLLYFSPGKRLPEKSSFKTFTSSEIITQ